MIFSDLPGPAAEDTGSRTNLQIPGGSPGRAVSNLESHLREDPKKRPASADLGISWDLSQLSQLIPEVSWGTFGSDMAKKSISVGAMPKRTLKIQGLIIAYFQTTAANWG